MKGIIMLDAAIYYYVFFMLIAGICWFVSKLHDILTKREIERERAKEPEVDKTLDSLHRIGLFND